MMCHTPTFARGGAVCATCRVRIISSTEELPPPSELEKKTLERFECPENVRLACQLVPVSGTIELERVLPAGHRSGCPEVTLHTAGG